MSSIFTNLNNAELLKWMPTKIKMTQKWCKNAALPPSDAISSPTEAIDNKQQQDDDEET